MTPEQLLTAIGNASDAYIDGDDLADVVLDGHFDLTAAATKLTEETA